jgi:menaquinone-dependent protoporphyrinogen oxidase
MRVIMAFGSARGGTAGLAEMLGDALTEQGCSVLVAPARDVDDLDGADAVVVAGALYAGRWHRDARRFVRRHHQVLRGLPVWLVSSGPLDDSAVVEEIAPTRGVRKLATLIGARGHVTFGGRLAPDATGFIASSMAKTRAGDWRDPVHVRRWVRTVVADLAGTRT